MSNYNHKEVEAKWKSVWEKSQIYKTKEDSKKEKFYVLDMFPYPSGSGLHVGHPKGYIATDVIARMKMMQGFNVLHPMGWDAFGLPAENYALANKVHPSEATAKNIETFKRQLGLLGFTYDWDREVNTTDPNYYRWTQWAFIQMFKKGLAFESNEPINWCPTCKTGLANEDLEDGKCERCGTLVERKPLRQWVLKITDYADRLLNDIDKLSAWPEPIKEMQRNWIGKSEGALVKFNIKNSEEILEVFTTRLDTLFGATYCVISPEHPLLMNNELGIKNYDEVNEYVIRAKNKSDLERTENKEKTGVELKGIKAINPANNEELPIFVADYVLTGYGTGAIMAVPAHDERDFEFAQKFGLPIKEVVVKKFGERRSDAIKRDGVAGVLTYKDKVLVLHDPKFDLWRLPAGGYEDGETDIEALLRETEEESQYKNFKVKDFLGTIEANFGVIYEDKYRHKYQKGYLMELVDEEETTIPDPDNVGFEHYWLSFEEAMKKFALNKESWGEEEFVRRAFDMKERCFSGEGTAINSDFLNDLSTSEAKAKMIAWLEEKGIGQRKIQYKLRDWVFSRQRYWGEPIPLIHCENCKNKKYNYIIIHGLSGDSHYGFKPWLKENLEKEGHHVYSPDLPNSNEPNINEQVDYILKNVDFDIDENTVLVGHSLGAVDIYKLLEKIKKPVAKVVLVDPVVKPEFNDVDRPAVTKSNDWKFNWKKIKNNCKQFIVLGDKRHIIIKKEHLEELASTLGATLNIVESNHVHFSNRKENVITEEPEVLKACESSGWIPVPDSELPLELPKVKNYEPSGTGESPLANIEEWVNTKCPVCGGPAKRETNTMPQWAGSCWYYLGYCMSKDKKTGEYSWDKEKINYWLGSPKLGEGGVDLYVGGAEHATRHLIYARFWHKFLFDIGAVGSDEPFTRLQNVGLILAEDGRKMSKRWNNVINPDDIVEQYGADAMRLYEMFMGPFDQPVAWSTQGVVGMRRFLEKVWTLRSKVHKVEKSIKSNIDTLLHQTIKKVSEDIEAMRYNTAISQMMILVNEMSKLEVLSLKSYGLFLQLLSPFAPHIAEELWSELGNKESIFKSDWPKHDPELIKDETIVLAVQVNGKLRDTLEVPADISEEEAKSMALASEKVQKWLEGKEPKKVIYVKGKLVSVVV